MCHGHPKHHPCSHTSIHWHYCPSALIDLETGYETPCSNISFAAAQPAKSDCPLENCQFKVKGGSWACCRCQQGPNTQGWCCFLLARPVVNPITSVKETVISTCDHGCCSRCTRLVPSGEPTPGMSFPEMRKGSASRKFGYASAPKSHRRGSAFSLVGGLPPVSGESSSSSSSSSPTSTSKRGSGGSAAGNSMDLDHLAKKSKSSKKQQKGKSRA